MSEQISTNPEASVTKPKKKWSQERAMLRLAIIFVGGVIIFTFIPEEHPLRPLLMPVFIAILVWGIFKQ